MTPQAALLKASIDADIQEIESLYGRLVPVVDRAERLQTSYKLKLERFKTFLNCLKWLECKFDPGKAKQDLTTMTQPLDGQLSSVELQHAQSLLQGYPEVEAAIATLAQNNGDIGESFDALWAEEVGQLGMFDAQGRSLRGTVLKVLREEVCGDDGFRSKMADYVNHPASATALTSLIAYLVTLTTLPINPALATVIVLYMLKLGLAVFCEYTAPAAETGEAP